MNKRHSIILIALYMLLMGLIIGCSILFSSCKVLKQSHTVTKDTTHIAKVDSGHVVVNSINKTDSLTWWRDILTFLPKGHDTIINNIPVNNYYPAQIIHEGGTAKSVSNQINYDSLWNNRLDSLSAHLNRIDTSKKKTVLGFWQILSFGLIAVVVLYIAAKLGKKFL